MINTKQIFSILVTLLLLIGCTPKHGTDTYSSKEIAQPTEVIKGNIVSIREVEIHGDFEGGSAAGMGVGAAAGINIGGGDGNLLGFVIGAIIGSIIGASMEEEATKQQGYEYLIRQEDGQMLAVVESHNKENLKVGEDVLILIGEKSRVIRDTTNH